MTRYRITLNLKTESVFTNTEVIELMHEQWEQTAASSEGDTISIESVYRVEE